MKPKAPYNHEGRSHMIREITPLPVRVGFPPVGVVFPDALNYGKNTSMVGTSVRNYENKREKKRLGGKVYG